MGRSRDLADGTLAELNVDSNTLAVDSTNNRVGIGTSSPLTNLDIRQNTNADVQLQLYNNNSSVGYASVLKLNADNTTGSRYNAITSYNGATAQWRISGGGSDSTLAFATGSSNTERLRILSSGGITFNGDTSSSNALDDYEEGSFTPTVTGSSSGGPFTFSSNNCRYVKIGRLVKASYWLVHNSSITFSGAYKITLPFTVSGDYAGGGYISYFQNFISTKPDIFQIEANTNYGYLRRLISSTDNQQFDLDPAMFQTNTGFMLTVMYETNA